MQQHLLFVKLSFLVTPIAAMRERRDLISNVSVRDKKNVSEAQSTDPQPPQFTHRVKVQTKTDSSPM